jgi:hypothetical protein
MGIRTTQEKLPGSFAIGATITSGTPGSVLFIGAGGVLAQDNANLFFDDTNNRLGIGSVTPQGKLHIAGTGSEYIAMGDAGASYVGISLRGTPPSISSTGYNFLSSTADPSLYINGTALHFRIANATKMIVDSSGNVGIGTNSPAKTLSVNGDAVFWY